MKANLMSMWFSDHILEIPSSILSTHEHKQAHAHKHTHTHSPIPTLNKSLAFVLYISVNQLKQTTKWYYLLILYFNWRYPYLYLAYMHLSL